jgi:transcriptional regulator with PAS, ATPase and Fis domain
MDRVDRWWDEVAMAVTVTDREGTIVAMNGASAATFAADGGVELVGRNVFACHPEPARSLLQRLFALRSAHHYTISKAGQRKIIHQLPWYRNGEFAGFVELSIPIPDELPHFHRG